VRHPELVSRIAFVLGVVLLAGCGGSATSMSTSATTLETTASKPTTALLTNVRAGPKQVAFDFRSAPLQIKAGYVPRSKVVESGSGRPVKVAGSAFLVVRFSPASGADLSGTTMRIVYEGPRRLEPATPGPVREVARTSDYEADLAWAIGLDRRRPYHVERHGSNVAVTVG
jgi:hypothetical protein